MKWLNCSKIKMVLSVFVVGGFLSMASVCSAVEYIWTQKADMPTPRCWHTSAVVNGKIYIIGGYPSEGEPGATDLSTVEEYDPVTNTWTRKADMPTARCDFIGSSAVVDGKIYVIGGCTSEPSWIALSTMEAYDPATDTWTRKADMPTRRWSLGTCAVNGKIYAIGGSVSGGFSGLNVLEQYDPKTDTWTRKANMPTGVWGLCTCVVDGKIYALGGRPGYFARNYVQEYDPATDTWTRKGDMPVGTSQMGSVQLGNKIVVMGGWEISNKYPYTTVQIYDTETDTWTIEADLPFKRAVFSAEVVNNRIYVIGGTDRPHPCPALSTVYEFGPLVDFNGDGIVGIRDLVILIESWGTDNPLCDIVPPLYGDGIVDVLDLEVFMSSWGQTVDDPTLVAHWKLDETEGSTAHDSSGDKDATLNGNPVWQPTSGKIDGALQLDGVDDYVRTPYVLNPVEGAFSVFAWIKGGSPGQAIISQAYGANWLLADPSAGKLMTELQGAGRGAAALMSNFVITDGQWHRIGFVWDGSYRTLYVDDIEVAKDTKPQGQLIGADVGLYIGAGKGLEADSFFSGLIDDVRIYNRAVTP